MTEEWKVIQTCPLYEVSNIGRVRNRGTLRILHQTIQSSGNAIVCLSNKGSIKTYSVCRLIMEAFMPCDNMKQLCIVYKDGNKSNNSLDNLEWRESYTINKVAMPNEIKELKNSIILSVNKAIDEWCKKYDLKFE